MKVLIIGENGQLGFSLKKIVAKYGSKNHFFFTTKLELDLNSYKSISVFFTGRKFDVIVNCAAYTKVDKAEKEKEIANQVNHIAVKLLAEIAFKRNIKLIHISTDHVFDGRLNRPYIEK